MKKSLISLAVAVALTVPVTAQAGDPSKPNNDGTHSPTTTTTTTSSTAIKIGACGPVH